MFSKNRDFQRFSWVIQFKALEVEYKIRAVGEFEFCASQRKFDRAKGQKIPRTESNWRSKNIHNRGGKT